MTTPVQRKTTLPFPPLPPKADDKLKPTKSRKPAMTTKDLARMALTGLGWSIVLFFVASYLITESWTWGYRGKWTNVNNYLPRKELVFSEEQLYRYDGSNPNLPIYVAIDGDVYDVSTGAGWYSVGGSYHHFAGKDAARAYVTGCFKEHITHDLRGLTDDQLKGVDHWKKFYQNHRSYFRVGRVLHPPIDDSTPIPEPCESAVGQKPKGKNH